MEQFLREVENILLVTGKRLVKGPAGSRKGKGYGTSLDFHGHREYMPGDDIRKVDWRAFARTGNFYVREFTEERQMQVNIFLDTSASMDFGAPNKWTLAQMAALGLSYITLKQWDKLSLFAVSDHIQVIREQVRGKDSFYQLLQPVWEIKPGGQTNFSSLTGRDKLGSGIAFIISDLFSVDLPGLLNYLRSQGQEVVLLHLLAPQETDPDGQEELKLVDKETGESRLVYLDERTRNLYRTRIREFIQECKTVCDYRAVRYVFCLTDTPPAAVVARAAGVM